MASEFDNEMDFLLRQAAQQTDFVPSFVGESAHLDADDLSAFAENVLPERARPAFVSHLADCNSCRQILSNLILLNEAASEETATITEPEKNIVASLKPSWLDSLKKLFTVPALGYATGTLAILLVGAFAFVALRTSEENRLVTVARNEPEQNEAREVKKQAAVRAPAVAKDEADEPKQEEQAQTETSNTNVDPLAESSAPAPVENTDDNLPPSVIATKRINQNSTSANIAAPRREASAANSSNINSAANAPAREAQPAVPASAGAIAQPGAAEDQIDRATVAKPKPEQKGKVELSERARNEKAEADNAQNDLVQSAPSLSASAKTRAASSSVSGESNKSVVVETRAIGGKTFQKIGGVWFDSGYNSQNAINVARGSDEYKKLDAGLRSIAENLGGEIVVVWQGRAYRIR